MIGHLQQIVAVVINGNAFRQGVSIDGFWPGSSAFTFEHETSFHCPKPRGLKREWAKVSPDPISWFKANAAGYRIHCKPRGDPNISDRMASGFANGGTRWLIEAVRDQRSSFWEGSMEVSHPDAEDRKIWTTRYYCVESDRPFLPEAIIELSTAQDRLRSALEKIHAFARRRESGFAQSFGKALEEIDSRTPSPFGWQHDLLPRGLELALAARQLLAASQAGYVFGAMGSWNDQSWADAEIEMQYEEVSEALFDSLQVALVAATNSTFSGG